jgi:hypothetical protein
MGDLETAQLREQRSRHVGPKVKVLVNLQGPQA